MAERCGHKLRSSVIIWIEFTSSRRLEYDHVNQRRFRSPRFRGAYGVAIPEAFRVLRMVAAAFRLVLSVL